MTRAVVMAMAAGVVACGPATEAMCGPSTCGGCCTSSGVCLESPGALACGLGGMACGACASSQQCLSGACVRVMSNDAGQSPDASADAGAVDAGSGGDAGPAVDSGALDAGAADAGAFDAGVVCPSSTLSPANLVTNGDFECLGGPSFSAVGQGRVDSVQGRAGRGVRLTVGAGLFGTDFVSTWRHRLVRGGRYCFRAQVRGTATNVTVRIYAGPAGSAAGEQFEQPGPLSGWQRMPPTMPALSVDANAGDEVFFTFSDGDGVAGSTIELDDLDLFRTEDGTCRDR